MTRILLVAFSFSVLTTIMVVFFPWPELPPAPIRSEFVETSPEPSAMERLVALGLPGVEWGAEAVPEGRYALSIAADGQTIITDTETGASVTTTDTEAVALIEPVSQADARPNQ